MSDIKLSLIFCCYNVSVYLDDIYNWLCKQSYGNIEVIFVEDCSTDDTREKLYSLVNDPRMKIIENYKNLGLSESRNVGLRYATGDYIGFPDPDDMFDVQWLQNVAKAANDYAPKVIITGMREDYEKNDVLEYSKNITSKYHGFIQSALQDVLTDLEETLLFGYMNNKFYDYNILIENNINCKTMALKEDFEFNIQVFSKINDFYILNKPYYFYKKRINGNSLTAKFVPEYFDIHEKSVFMFKELLESKGQLTESAQRLLINRFYRYVLSAIERNTDKRSELSFNAQVEWVNNVVNNPDYKYFMVRKKLISGKLGILRVIFNLRMLPCLVVAGYFMSAIKNTFPVLFAKLK